MELGRQEAFGFPDRRRDPFSVVANTCLETQPAEPVTVESLAHAYAALVEAVGPLPRPHPVLDLDRVLVMKPDEFGARIYWRIS